MRKAYRFAVLSALFFWSFAVADIGSGFNAGAGTRALSFANNHVAVASDLSAVYWNPAALALLPVREFQLSFDMLRVDGSSEVAGPSVTSAEDNGLPMERIRLSGAGWMTAIPTTQGGLTLAFSYDQPFVFDDVSAYSYNIGRDYYALKGRRHGGLDRWSGAFGVQVAEQVSAGLTVSLVTGKESMPIFQKMVLYMDGRELIDSLDGEFNNSYLGYTLTGGLLYYPTEIVKIGLRVNAAMNISVQETFKGNGQELDTVDGIWYEFPIEGPYSPRKGRAHVAPNGILGVGVTLPWMILALDARLTMPFTLILPSEEIPKEVQARNYKFGAGAGAEIPLPSAPVVFRAGYSVDEYDLFPIIHDFEDWGIDWETGREFEADGLKHTITAGIGVFSSGMGFEASYGYQTWGLVHKRDERVLAQRYHNHRVAAALIYRY
jgi:hypothetical protein